MSVREAPPRTPLPAARTSPSPRPVRGGGRRVRLGDPVLRLRGALLFLAILLSLFAGRLVQIQGVEASGYADRAQDLRMLTKVLPAVRGTITDAEGVPLVTSVDARDVTVDQTLVADPAATAARLAPVLGLDAAVLRERLTGDKRFAYVARRVTPETWRQVADLELPGVLSQPSSRRVYPGGELAANVLGFVGEDGRGLSGLEHSLDEQLAGRDGSARFEVGKGGAHIPLGANSTVAPVPGATIHLTLDRDVQWYAQRRVAQAVQEAKAVSGTVVVLDAGSGDVLALATAPTFDPNDPAKAPAEDRGNRALSEVYEPGSTGKVLTAAAVVEGGVVDASTPFVVDDTIERGGTTFRDHDRHPREHLTFAGVIAKSSNVGTILAAERISPETLHDYYTRFGIGSTSGLGLPGESRGIFAPPQKWSGSQRYTIPFGQGYSVNAVQMASAFATIADDGVRVAPRLVSGWTGEHGEEVAAPAPETRRVVSAETARAVREMMETVVGEGGTGIAAAVPGYRIGGKTGTANRVDPETGRYRGYTASFIGIAPADGEGGRRLVVAAVLQDPKKGYFGGQVAGPVFRDVTSFALQRLRIPPTGAPAPSVRLESR